jgi:hypothetical protein
VGRRGIEKKKGKAMTDRAEMVSQAENKEERNWAEKINFRIFIQGLWFPTKSFKYFQTKFELNSKEDKFKTLFWIFFKFETFENCFKYANSNQGFKRRSFKIIRNEISKSNLNLFITQNQPRAPK